MRSSLIHVRCSGWLHVVSRPRLHKRAFGADRLTLEPLVMGPRSAFDLDLRARTAVVSFVAIGGQRQSTRWRELGVHQTGPHISAVNDFDLLMGSQSGGVVAGSSRWRTPSGCVSRCGRKGRRLRFFAITAPGCWRRQPEHAALRLQQAARSRPGDVIFERDIQPPGQKSRLHPRIGRRDAERISSFSWSLVAASRAPGRGLRRSVAPLATAQRWVRRRVSAPLRLGAPCSGFTPTFFRYPFKDAPLCQ
jgi:hypothetical protein